MCTIATVTMEKKPLSLKAAFTTIYIIYNRELEI